MENILYTRHEAPVQIRFDGTYPDVKGDNLAFTFLSHFMGTGNRDFYKTSWIGINSVLKTGVRLEDIQIVLGGK